MQNGSRRKETKLVTSQEPDQIDEGNLPRPYDDVRQWLDLVEKMGELKRVNGADWNLEIGTMAELIYRERTGTIPALHSTTSKVIPRDIGFCSASKLPIAVSRLWPACQWTAWD